MKKIFSAILVIAMIMSTFSFTVSANTTDANLPEAEVTVLPRMTLTAADHNYMCWPSGDTTINRPLEIVMNFKTNETTEEARPNGFLPWKVDFYLTFEGLANGSIVADNCYLAGNYGSFGWIVIPTDGMELEANVEYPVVAAYDANITYKQICDSVKNFTAAIHVDQDILDANPDFKVTLKLKMTNPDNADDVVVIGEPATYTAEDLATKEDTVIEMDDPEVELCEDGYYRCIKNGVAQVGWVTTNAGYRYYFSKAAATYGAAMIGKNKRVGSQYYDFYVDGRLIEYYEEDGTPVLYKHKNGFITEDGVTRYYDDNEYRIGWQYIDGYKYYFSKATGIMLSGSNQIGHLVYNLDENGRWIGYYQTPYTEEESPKATDVVKDADGEYRYYVDGVAYSGWKVLPGADGFYKYYFSKADGAAINTYGTQVGGEFYDFRPTGTLIKVDYVDGDAVMYDYILSPEQGIKNGLTFDDDGKYRFYIDGEFQSGLKTVDGVKYLFRSSDGSAITSADHHDENGYRYGSFYYVFDEVGKMVSRTAR